MDHSGDPGWHQLADALAEATSRFSTGIHLQIFDEAGDVYDTAGEAEPRYVQLWQNPDAIVAEVSSTTHLPPERRVAPDVENRLADLGWTPPQRRDNWRRSVPWPSASGAYLNLATSVVSAWRGIFGVDSPQRLRYRAFDSTTGQGVAMPSLGLQWQGELRAWLALQLQ